MRKLGLELRSLMNLIVRYTHKQSNKSYMSLPHVGVLRFLIDHEDKDINPRDLEDVFMIRKSTCSRMLSVMEENNLIFRVEDAIDNRKKIIKLTDKSRQLIAVLESKYEQFESEIVENINKEDIGTFFKVLDKIKANLIQKQKDEDNYDKDIEVPKEK